MQGKAQLEGKPVRKACPEELLFLELLRTTDILSRGPAQLLKANNLSPAQYNVLRILRGAADGLPCGEIGNRMITRDPDITRLVDRLARRGLISRRREASDRRTVLVRITPDGLELLDRLDDPVEEMHREQMGHLSRERQHALSELLREARGGAA